MPRTLPQEAFQLAAHYELGTPVKRYTFSTLGIAYLSVIIILSGIPLLLGIFGLIATGLMMLFAPYSSTDFSFLIGFLVIAALLSPVSIFFLILTYFNCSEYAYECTDGFLLIKRKTHQVEHALRWDEILEATSSASRYGTTYHLTSIQHRRFTMPFRGIWKKCQQSLKQGVPRHFTRVGETTPRSLKEIEGMPGPRVSNEKAQALIAQIRTISGQDAQAGQGLEKLRNGIVRTSQGGQHLQSDLAQQAEAEQVARKLVAELAQQEGFRQLLERFLADLAAASRWLEQFQTGTAEVNETQRLLERFLVDFKDANRLLEWFGNNFTAETADQQLLADFADVKTASQQFLTGLREVGEALDQQALESLLAWERTHPAEAHAVGDEVRTWINELSSLLEHVHQA